MQKIVTNLWYGDNAEEAVNFYCSLFDDAEILDVQHYTEVGPGEAGTVLLVNFAIAGQRFTAINGGEGAKYTHAMSLLVNCEGQEEVDRLWDALTADGGKEDECGWLFDKYGVPWQIWPTEADRLVGGPDPEAAQRAMKCMLGQRKIVLREIQDAYDGK